MLKLEPRTSWSWVLPALHYRAFIRSRRPAKFDPYSTSHRRLLKTKMKFVFISGLYLNPINNMVQINKKSHWTSWCSHFRSLFQGRFGVYYSHRARSGCRLTFHLLLLLVLLLLWPECTTPINHELTADIWFDVLNKTEVLGMFEFNVNEPLLNEIYAKL
jgi:hypothetical protein